MGREYIEVVYRLDVATGILEFWGQLGVINQFLDQFDKFVANTFVDCKREFDYEGYRVSHEYVDSKVIALNNEIQEGIQGDGSELEFSSKQGFIWHKNNLLIVYALTPEIQEEIMSKVKWMFNEFEIETLPLRFADMKLYPLLEFKTVFYTKWIEKAQELNIEIIESNFDSNSGACIKLKGLSVDLSELAKLIYALKSEIESLYMTKCIVKHETISKIKSVDESEKSLMAEHLNVEFLEQTDKIEIYGRENKIDEFVEWALGKADDMQEEVINYELDKELVVPFLEKDVKERNRIIKSISSKHDVDIKIDRSLGTGVIQGQNCVLAFKDFRNSMFLEIGENAVKYPKIWEKVGNHKTK